MNSTLGAPSLASERLPSPAAGRTAKALRFLTAGSVDDGKSTLIGRLLLDSKAILADQWDQLQHKAVGDQVDLSLLTDGLEAEREQGITIDVAYRYFATPRRKFIIADAPGHEQYTRNMVTAAAGSDAAVVLVDITKLQWQQRPVQLLPQTRRHALLAQRLRVPSIVFAVNKLDAVEDAQTAFEAVHEALHDFCRAAGFEAAGVVPVSALRGDNITVVAAGSWYAGPSLLSLLESLAATEDNAEADLAIPVQYVARYGGEADDSANPERVFWGRIASGTLSVGDTVEVRPGGHSAIVRGLHKAGLDVDHVDVGQSAGLVLDRHLDVSRGDWFVSPGAPSPTSRFRATLAWLDTEPAAIGRRLWLRHGHRWVQGRITQIASRLEIQTLQPQPAEHLNVNDIGVVHIELQQPLPLQAFSQSRVAGAMIIVDPSSHRTSGAVMVEQLID